MSDNQKLQVMLMIYEDKDGKPGELVAQSPAEIVEEGDWCTLKVEFKLRSEKGHVVASFSTEGLGQIGEIDDGE